MPYGQEEQYAQQDALDAIKTLDLAKLFAELDRDYHAFNPEGRFADGDATQRLKEAVEGSRSIGPVRTPGTYTFDKTAQMAAQKAAIQAQPFGGSEARSATKFSGVQQIAQAAYNAGFRGNDLQVAVAIALAESGGNPNAKGDVHLANNKWGPSLGYWQIRSLNAERGTGGTRDPNKLYDPQQNANSAYAIYKTSRGFNHWTMYSNGGYKKHLSTADAAIQSLGLS